MRGMTAPSKARNARVRARLMRARALAALAPHLPPEERPQALQEVRRSALAALRAQESSSRSSVLALLADERVFFAPPLCSPATLGAIARHIAGICWEWR